MTGFSFLGNTTSPFFWVAWSLALVWQNYAFTRVSRARNSGSLKAHALAALQSNGVWFIQSLFVYSAFMSILTGKAGILKAIGAALYYTAFTMAGSIYAHYTSLKKEKGATAVGANKKYAQIPVEAWEKAVKRLHVLDLQMEKVAENFSPEGELRLESLNRVEALRSVINKVESLPSIEEFNRVRGLAENAYDITIGLIPDSGIRAQKFGSEVVTTGLKNS